MASSNTSNKQDHHSDSSTTGNEYDILAGPDTAPLKPIRDLIDTAAFMNSELQAIPKIVNIIKDADPDLPKAYRAIEHEAGELLATVETHGLPDYVQEQNANLDRVKADLNCIEWCQYDAWRKGVAILPTINWQTLNPAEPLPTADFLNLYSAHAEALRVVLKDPSITLEHTFRLFRSQDPVIHRFLPLVQAVVTMQAHIRGIDEKTHNQHLQSAAKASQKMKSVVAHFDTFIDKYENAYDNYEAHVKAAREEKQQKEKEQKERQQREKVLKENVLTERALVKALKDKAATERFLKEKTMKVTKQRAKGRRQMSADYMDVE